MQINLTTMIDQVRKMFPEEVMPYLNPARQVRISQVKLDEKIFKAEEEHQ